ncbi:terminase large subunit domain-containing protein [Modestobacter sp. KNN46-3]|uniref:phage terminase large subunit family protein n=1 Tax=Modestobacter sp. KNN46-3 TaxID=2711218 RepID=UPI0013E0A903|nr:terminase family protein [Modestobacter sp. KNN46-3]
MARSVWDLVADAFDPSPPVLPDYEPQPKQQIAADLVFRVSELLFGGAAGGGKSYWLRNDAVLFALTHERVHIGIVRRTLPMLKQTHLMPLTAICNGIAKHNRAELTWTFPNGSVIRFISLTHIGDEQNYKSVEFDRLYFDEGTELAEVQYTYMLTRLRSSFGGHCDACNQRGHRTAAIMTSNPEGVGYAWVKRRFVAPRPADLGKGQGKPEPFVPWQPPLPDGTPGLPRVFVPSTLMDNPALLASNPDYVNRLKSMPDDRKRKALLEGDWDAMDQVPGALFSLTNIEAHRAHNGAPESLARVVVGYDPASTFTDTSDETGIVAAASAQATRPRQLYVLADRSGHFSGPEAAARACVDLAAAVSADVIVYETNQGGDYVKSALMAALRHAVKEGRWTGPLPKVLGVHAKRGKALRAEPVSVLYGQGQVHHVGPFDELEAQMTTWTPDAPNSPDRLDALVYAITHLENKGAPAAPVKARSTW